MIDHPRRGPDDRRSRSVIIIERNGHRTAITGWRAWLAEAGVFAVLVLLFALIALVLFGVAITVGVVLAFLIPAAIVLALVATIFNRWRLVRSDQRADDV